jgi:phosphoglycerol transferase MdoB-like AlkP superfamily enzyme
MALPIFCGPLRGSILRPLSVGICLTVALGPVAASRLETLGLHRNALMALVTTAFPRVQARASSQDWRQSPFSNPNGEDLTPLRGAAAGRNVMLILLESTAAQYLGLYGASEDPMPSLSRLAGQGIVFEHAYAAYPESIRELVAVFCSRYPALDIQPEDYARITTSSLAREFARAGYRTALFHSGVHPEV